MREYDGMTPKVVNRLNTIYREFYDYRQSHVADILRRESDVRFIPESRHFHTLSEC